MMRLIGFVNNADWLRKQYGITYASLHREGTNPNDIIAVLQFKDMKGAKDFARAVPSLMENIGGIGKPEIWFAEYLEQVTYS